MKPRILAFDIESTPNLGWGYGKWQVNLIKIERYSDMLSFSYRWIGESKTHHVSLRDHDFVEKDLALALHALFDEADVVLAHNAYGFDNKIARATWVRYGIAPPSPYKVIDTLRIARSQFKFPGGNSLNEVAIFLGLGRKADVGIRDLWYDCYIENSGRAWRLLKKYNNMDVDLLVGVYEAMLPYISNHPNLAMLYRERGRCPKCLSDKLQARGTSKRAAGEVQRYQCQACAGWCNEASVRHDGRVTNIS